MQDDSSNFTKFFTDTSVLEDIASSGRNYSDEASGESKPMPSPEVDSTILPPILSGKDFPPLWELESRPFLVDGMIQKSDTVLLTSPAKVGKSFIWANMAMSIATGTPFLGKQTTQSNVLIIDLELRRDVAIDRLTNIANKLGFEKVPENLYLWSLARHTYRLNTIIEVLHSRLQQLPEIGLIVVDPLYVIDRSDAEGGGEFDENNAHSVTRLIIELEQLTTEQGSALGLVHHTRKGNLNSTDSMDRSSGSSAFSRYPSVIMNVSRHEIDNCGIIEFTTRNFKSPSPICYEMKAPLVLERPDLDSTKFRRYGNAGISEVVSQDVALKALPNHAVSKQEWFARCRSAGVKESEFLQLVDEMLSSGLVIETKDGFAKNMGAGI